MLQCMFVILELSNILARCSISTGLVRWRSNPHSSVRFRTSAPPQPVSAIIMTSLPPGSRRIRRAVS